MKRRRESKKSNSLTRQSNNFARASRIFVYFFAVTARLPRENAKNPTLWDGTYLYGLYKEVPQPPRGHYVMIPSYCARNLKGVNRNS